MNKGIDLSIVIVSYNTAEFLSNCLNSIKNSVLGKYRVEVVVVDNGSADDSVKVAKRFQKGLNLRVFSNKTNVGFAVANNTGVIKTSGCFVLFLNPDTILEKSTLVKMLEFMQDNPRVGVSCPRVELPDGSLDYASHRGFPTPWNSFCYFSGLQGVFPKSRWFAGYTMGWLLDSGAVHEVDSVVGAFFLVRREAGKEVGWWDEDYFWYGDELDFCYRLKEKGWKVMFVPTVKMLHFKGVSSGIQKNTWGISTATRAIKLRASRASTEAMKIFYQKHYKDKYPRVVTLLVISGINFLQLLRRLRHSF